MLQMKKKINPYLFPGLDIEPQLVNIVDIIYAVKESTKIEMDEIKSNSRVSDIKDARHLLAFFLKKRTCLTFQKIGDLIDKHHATVLHACNRVNDMREYDPYFKKHVPAVNHIINNLN